MRGGKIIPGADDKGLLRERDLSDLASMDLWYTSSEQKKKGYGISTVTP